MSGCQNVWQLIFFVNGGNPTFTNILSLDAGWLSDIAMPNSLINILLNLLKFFYIVCSIGLFLVGVNTIVNCILFLMYRKKIWARSALPANYAWPKVTLQLPTYNERYVLEGLLRAVASLDYPSGQLQIQVLDDSTDSTSELARRLVKRYLAVGMNIQLLHRDRRAGYKAGALVEGLKTATGEFIALLDADFVPGKDWLKQTIPYFRDQKVGFIQTRWAFSNRNENLITRMASLVMDAHFVVEQTARVGAGLLTNFNGAAGVWRRAAIEAAGGWQADTLTEDLDLSLRAQILGWKAMYLPRVYVPSQSPDQIGAYKNQQYRWVKGTAQVGRKHLVHLWKSPLPFLPKLMMSVNLTLVCWSFILVLLAQILFLPIGLYAPHIFVVLGFSGTVAVGPMIIFLLAQTDEGPRLKDRLLMLPIMVLMGVGFSVNNSLGVLSGMVSMGGVFERTPKFDRPANGTRPANKLYKSHFSPAVWGELAMAVYFVTSVIILMPRLGFGMVPYMLLSAASYFTVGSLSLGQNFRRARPALVKKEAGRSPETIA
jgi:cellulose synthase/poly-beta-1,6-N-acetylglucosamine synthase-like glycosyltransferase